MAAKGEPTEGEKSSLPRRHTFPTTPDNRRGRQRGNATGWGTLHLFSLEETEAALSTVHEARHWLRHVVRRENFRHTLPGHCYIRFLSFSPSLLFLLLKPPTPRPRLTQGTGQTYIYRPGYQNPQETNRPHTQTAAHVECVPSLLVQCRFCWLHFKYTMNRLAKRFYSFTISR